MEDAARLEVGLTLVPQPTTELEELLFVEPLVELLVVVLPQPASKAKAKAAPRTKNARLNAWKRRTRYPQI
jgi:hypothetical protein